MLDLHRWALITVVTLAGLWSEPALATDERHALDSAAEEFHTGKKLYRAGQTKAGLEKMERAVEVLQRLEDDHGYREPLPENPTKKQKQAWSLGVAFGSISPFRARLAEILLAHGCYRKAVVLQENDLKHFKSTLSLDTSNAALVVSLARSYLRHLYRLDDSHRQLGQFDRAIAINEEMLAVLRHWIGVGIGQWPEDWSSDQARLYYADTTLALALLHEDAGNRDEAQRLAAEARRLHEDFWRQWPPSEAERRRREARLFTAEGRHEDAKAAHEEIVAAELRQEPPDKQRLARAYARLAAAHHRSGAMEAKQAALENALRYREEIIAAELEKAEPDKTELAWAYGALAAVRHDKGEAEPEISALESAHRYHSEARRQDFASMVVSAHRLATALRKAGRAEATKALRDKYQLCLD